jgi:NADPH2:quinone reductase
MKAILVREFGGPEVLKLEDIPMPRPAAGQVLVRIHAVGVNPSDTYRRSGVYPINPPLPYTPDSDGAGIVESAGEGVTKVKKRDRVYLGKAVTGAYAEYALTLEDQVNLLPDKITFAPKQDCVAEVGPELRADSVHVALSQQCFIGM